MTDEYYWAITTRSGEKIYIPPAGVEIVKRRWENKQPIHTNNRTISYFDIKSFDKTSKRTASNQLLLEGASQAFRDPLINEDGSIQARWVKKPVTALEWERYYSPSLYKRLRDEDGMVIIAFRLAIHDIDTDKVTYCTPTEVQKLEG